MSVVNDLDGIRLRSSMLNEFKECSMEVCGKHLLHWKVNVPYRSFAKEFGTTVHFVEESTWNMIKEFPDKLLPLSFLKHCSIDKLRKHLTSIKATFIPPFHDHIFDAANNLSWMDAVNFFNLRKHFDRNVDQARRYFIPLQMEMPFDNPGIKTKGLIDNVSMIPAKFKEYKNKKDTVVVKDYKPGKIKDGKPVIIDALRKYTSGTFSRQLVFYLLNGNFEIPVETKSGRTEMEPVETASYCGGMFYKTGQFLIEKKTGNAFNPVNKNVSEFWSASEFSRRERGDFWADHCNFCEVRTHCRVTPKEMAENLPGTIYLDDLVKKIKCAKCNKEITILKTVGRKVCCDCMVKSNEAG